MEIKLHSNGSTNAPGGTPGSGTPGASSSNPYSSFNKGNTPPKGGGKGNTPRGGGRGGGGGGNTPRGNTDHNRGDHNRNSPSKSSPDGSKRKRKRNRDRNRNRDPNEAKRRRDLFGDVARQAKPSGSDGAGSDDFISSKSAKKSLFDRDYDPSTQKRVAVVLRGLPGSGKSTICYMLRELFNGLTIEYDKLAEQYAEKIRNNEVESLDEAFMGEIEVGYNNTFFVGTVWCNTSML